MVSFSEVRNKLKSVVDQVINGYGWAVIVGRDFEGAVVVSFDWFNGLMEALQLLKSSANAAYLAISE